ncbi:transposase [Microvirga sp. SRT01]|uniref:Transposase n=1 Tax=Sphingomonas longa TaxID=2778730 RepID=A0ABS2D2T5_9SPHN|nr:transposase [Sphingomonas sp. BT552]MBR7708259.1 transposase [Microvirga sp. SRT01]
MRFHRFVGLSLNDTPPHHSTIRRFRNPLDMDVAGADPGQLQRGGFSRRSGPGR